MSGPDEPLPDHIPQEFAEGLEKLFRRLGPPPEDLQEFVELTGFSGGIPVAEVKSLSAVVGELMWLARLPAEEQEQFWWELYTTLGEVHSTRRDQQFGVYAAKAVGPLLHAWKATAQAHADGLPEILATTEQGDFGEVEPPYMPKYVKHSILHAKDGGRYRVVKVEGGTNGHYVLRPLFSGSARADLVLWEWKDCDEHTTLEWVDDKPVYALQVGTERLRTLTDDEVRELGVTTGDQ